MPTFGEIIRSRRIELGMTQEELAHKLGYRSRTTISRIEDGSRDVPQKSVRHIAQALDMDPAALITQQVSSEDNMTQRIRDIRDERMMRLLAYAEKLSDDDIIDIIHLMQYKIWKEKEAQNGQD